MSRSKYPVYRKRKTAREIRITDPKYDDICMELAETVLILTNKTLGTNLKFSDKSKPTGNGAFPRQIIVYILAVVYELPYMTIGRIVDRHRSSVEHGLGVIEDKRDDVSFDTLLSDLEENCLNIFPREKLPQEVLGNRYTLETYYENSYQGRFA